MLTTPINISNSSERSKSFSILKLSPCCITTLSDLSIKVCVASTHTGVHVFSFASYVLLPFKQIHYWCYVKIRCVHPFPKFDINMNNKENSLRLYQCWSNRLWEERRACLGPGHLNEHHIKSSQAKFIE